ncbi:MAG: ThuA domain-containing protein [Candidatus Coatesbacteria bacterium]
MIKRAAVGLVGLLLCGPAGAALEPVSAETVARIRAALPAAATAKPARPHRVLVFTLTRGFRHGSIAAGAKAFELLAQSTKAFRVTVSDDIAVFEPARLKAFDAVVLMNTTGELFLPPNLSKLAPKAQEKARARDAALKASLLAFVRRGNGLVGVHAATDCWYEWPEFGVMMGGWFNGHPWHEKVGVAIEDPAHPLVAAFGGQGFDVYDEIYTFRAPWSRRNVRVLCTLDRAKTPRKGNRLDDDYALAWVRAEGKGRVFYFGFGHDDAIFEIPAMLKCLLDGTQFALGDLPADTSPSSTLVDDPPDPFTGEYEGTYTRSGVSGVPAAAGTPTAAPAAAAIARVWPVGALKFRATCAAGPDTVEAAGAFDGREVELTRASFEDYITAWEVAGPFTKAGTGGRALFGEVFPPETPGATGVAWRAVTAEGGPPVVDLLKAVGGEERVAYLRATVESPVDQDAALELGTDDGVKVWLNGAVVHANDVMRGLEPGSDSVAVKLVKGANTILMKITQGGGGWEACAAVVPKTAPLGGVRGRAAGEVRWTGRVAQGGLELSGGPGVWALKRIARRSPTEGAPPPPGAVVLLPYGAASPPTMGAWDNANWRILPDQSVLVHGGDARTKSRFGDLTLHVEFRVPVVPEGSGQDRGNSGVYFQDRYEIQVLDSFGLPVEAHECGAIYDTQPARVNAALPPGTWQTYDIVFRGPVLDAAGAVLAPAEFVKVVWNGVLVHENVKVLRTTGGGSADTVGRGPLRLQDHGHAVRYRNIWVVEGAAKP